MKATRTEMSDRDGWTSQLSPGDKVIIRSRNTWEIGIVARHLNSQAVEVVGHGSFRVKQQTKSKRYNGYGDEGEHITNNYSSKRIHKHNKRNLDVMNADLAATKAKADYDANLAALQYFPWHTLDEQAARNAVAFVSHLKRR